MEDFDWISPEGNRRLKEICNDFYSFESTRPDSCIYWEERPEDEEFNHDQMEVSNTEKDDDRYEME